MLTVICKYINNWFTYDEDKHIGTYSIEGGVINPPLTIENGRYYRIIGSKFNDGVYKYGVDVLDDESSFDGAIWLMSVPKDFIELAGKIKAWNDVNGAVDSSNMSPFSSEHFDIYSYTMGGGSSSGGGASVTWQSQFAKELSRYRKIGV